MRGIEHQTFFRSGAGFISYSVDTFSVSPVYVVAAAARRLIQSGDRVVLPEGYSADTLDQITWLTGTYRRRVDVSLRQAAELAAIGQGLLDHNRSSLAQKEVEAATRIIQIVGGQG